MSRVISDNFDDSDADSQRESQIPDVDKCCVCKKFYVSRQEGQLFLTGWVQCDKCNHWVHLKFCTTLRVARSGTDFQCPCCTNDNEQ